MAERIGEGSYHTNFKCLPRFSVCARNESCHSRMGGNDVVVLRRLFLHERTLCGYRQSPGALVAGAGHKVTPLRKSDQAATTERNRESMGNKSSRVSSPLYGNPSPTYARPSPYGRLSGSLYSASAISRTGNLNYGAPSPAERGMLYCKTKNTTTGPTPSALYGKKSKSKSKAAPTPTSLYSKPSLASTPKPTPTSLYSKKSKGSLHRGFSRSSISRSGVSLSGASIGQPSPFAMSGASANSAYSRSTVATNGALAQMAMTSCVKCRMPFGDSSAAFCHDCGHPRPAGTVPVATAQRVSEGRNSFGKHAVAF